MQIRISIEIVWIQYQSGNNYLEVADDKKIKALYTIIQKNIQETEFEYPDELKDGLDKRYAEYKDEQLQPNFQLLYVQRLTNSK